MGVGCDKSDVIFDEMMFMICTIIIKQGSLDRANVWNELQDIMLTEWGRHRMITYEQCMSYIDIMIAQHDAH
jgi:hypothetical protein